MPRWEFHLTMDETGTSARWTWMYRLDGGGTEVSEHRFPTYRACIADALLHGYSAGSVSRYRESGLDCTG